MRKHLLLSLLTLPFFTIVGYILFAYLGIMFNVLYGGIIENNIYKYHRRKKKRRFHFPKKQARREKRNEDRTNNKIGC